MKRGESVVALADYLVSNERAIEQFTPVMYIEEEYDCAVTNFRILLYQQAKMKFTEIEHQNIMSISLEGRRPGTLAWGIICIIGGIVLPFFRALFFGWGIILAIMTILIGAFLIVYHFVVINYFIQIRGGGATFELYSEHDLLEKLVLVIRDIKYGKSKVTEKPSINVTVQNQAISSVQSEQNTKLCVHCGEQIRKSALYCDKCGKTQDLTEPEVLLSTETKQDTKFCIHCGGKIRSIAVYCDKCGKELEAPEPEVILRTSNGQNSKFCVYCGAAISSMAIFCDKCGKKQETSEPEIY